MCRQNSAQCPQPVAAGLLGEATVVGCKLYSVTSDPETQREGLEEENRGGAQEK